MTDKVRRRLVYKYTAIIAVMLLFFAVGGFAMCKYAVQKVIADTMYDAVAAEIREAEDAGVNENTPLKEMSAASDIGSIYSYAYWFAGDRLVFAEHPKDPVVDAVCRQKIAEPFADNKLQYFSLDDNRGRRWQFYMLAGRDGDRRVVILVNVTPFKLLSLRYIYLLLGALLLQMAEYPNKMFPGIGTVPVPIVILAVIAIGALVGAVNGFCTAKFNLHPFIVTLATQLIVYGTLLIYLMQGNNNGQSISGLDKSYTNLITGSILSVPDGKGNMVPIPNFVWYAIVITVVMWFVWNKTTFGKNMFAVGSNPEAANVSGVNVAATTILVFTLAGVMYGFTGFIEGARIGANTANTGLNYELDAIAACVIGGVSFVGGIGKIRGVIIGVVLLRIIFVGLTFMSVSSNLQYIIKGLIILVACAIDMRKYLVRK